MKSPPQPQFPFALGTRALMAKLIRDRLGVKLSVRSVGRRLAQLGWTCQRLMFAAYEQNPSLEEQGLVPEYPRLRRRPAHSGRKSISGTRRASPRTILRARPGGPAGQTPIVMGTGQRFGWNLISAVRAKGLLWFLVVRGRVAAGQGGAFLRRLMQGGRRPVFLILDGHPLHRAKGVTHRETGSSGNVESGTGVFKTCRGMESTAARRESIPLGEFSTRLRLIPSNSLPDPNFPEEPGNLARFLLVIRDFGNFVPVGKAGIVLPGLCSYPWT